MSEVVESSAAEAVESAPVESAEVSEQVVESAPVEASSEAEFQEEVADAIEDGATEAEVKSMIKEFELKVNGKSVKRSIDLSDEEAVKRELQKAMAGQEAMQRSAELEKLYAQEMERIRNDPWAAMKELGYDPDELAESRIQAKIEEMKKSPEELEREKLQKELEDERARHNELMEKTKQEQFMRMQHQESVKIENEITDALTAHTTLPKTRKTVSRIADAMIWAVENGYENVSVADVIPSVEAEIRKEIQDMMNEVPEDVLEAYIGKNNINRMRNKRISKAKSAPVAAAVKEVAKPSDKVESKESKKRKAKDFFRNL